MRILITPQAFKGSLTAIEAAEAIREGIRRAMPDAETLLVPVADGGDGTLEALVNASKGQVITTRVTGPLDEAVEAQWGAMGDGQTAVIEMARAAGLVLVPQHQRNPMLTTTYGVGELVRHALERGYRRFIVGIGGSATNDGGVGMAQALGAKFLDEAGQELGFGGQELARLGRIDLSGLDPRLAESRILVACDVTNPLTGPEGAAAVYGPQKGATPEMVRLLDAGLERLAAVVQRDLGLGIKDTPGAGAAGGLGGGLIAFLKAKLRPGVDLVLDAVQLEERLRGADLVITGEGCVDASTVYNKAPVGVARKAKALGIPVIAIAGSLGPGYQRVHDHGIDAAFAIATQGMDAEAALRNAYTLLAGTAEEVARVVGLS